MIQQMRLFDRGQMNDAVPLRALLNCHLRDEAMRLCGGIARRVTDPPERWEAVEVEDDRIFVPVTLTADERAMKAANFVSLSLDEARRLLDEFAEPVLSLVAWGIVAFDADDRAFWNGITGNHEDLREWCLVPDLLSHVNHRLVLLGGLLGFGTRDELAQSQGGYALATMFAPVPEWRRVAGVNKWRRLFDQMAQAIDLKIAAAEDRGVSTSAVTIGEAFDWTVPASAVKAPPAPAAGEGVAAEPTPTTVDDVRDVEERVSALATNGDHSASPGELADELHCSTDTINRIAKRLDLQTPARGQKNFRYPSADAQAIRRYAGMNAGTRRTRSAALKISK